MELVAIGKILRSIGVKGGMKISPLTDHLDRFENLTSILIGKNDKDVEKLDVAEVRIDPGQIVLYLKGIKSTEDTGRLRNSFLFVTREETIKLPKGSYFVDDLIGCDVVTEDRMNVGILSESFSLPSHDIWVVRKGKKEILIPAVKDIVKNVDVEKKRITINAIEGLLE